MNELKNESSPYLLQHALNPVHWKAWNEKSLQLAQKENKLIIVSIGYSTCHWCHVMEHESFENNDVADVMNKGYVSIKVDREERPDVDAYYMKAVQLMNQRGGWPLNVICLPDGKPIWGGTYFRKADWVQALETLQAHFQKSPEEFYEYAEKLSKGVADMSKAPVKDSYTPAFDLEDAIDNWVHYFDRTYGGYGKEPKFMIPNSLIFLQRYGHLNNNKSLLDFVDLTLQQMAWGGLFDTVHGGFSRYSVDKRWHIPHFEKMLYDNAQALTLYADGYKRTGNPLYKEVIEKTIRFMTDEWRNGKGGYFSAYDADSLNEHKQLKEGAFYSWKEEELEKIIHREEYPIFQSVFNINSQGHWEEGEYVLIQTKELDKIAKKHAITVDELFELKRKWEEQLKVEREKRVKPRLDDKTLTSWNAMLITGLLDAYTALDNKEYLALAEEIYHFIHNNLLDGETLMHTYKDGIVSIEGFLEDYAFYIAALIALYEHTLETHYLSEAKALTDKLILEFQDEESGFFFFNSKKQATTLHNSIETEDGVIPSANSQMANNILKLGLIYEDLRYTSIAEKMLDVMKNHINYGPYYSNWLQAELYLSNPSELLIAGKNALEEVLAIRQGMIAKSIVLGTKESTDIPYMKGKFKPEVTEFYLCTNRSCMQPQTSKGFLEGQKL